MKYFAYGSNMSRAAMQQRCPGVVAIGSFELKGFRLVFKYHADIIPAEGCVVHGGLWEITTDHETALDIYEGYPGYYSKHRQGDVMFYRMTTESASPLAVPSKFYLQTIIQGYHDFGLTQAEFEESLGVQQYELTRSDLEASLGVSTDELARLFSRGATAPIHE